MALVARNLAGPEVVLLAPAEEERVEEMVSMRLAVR